MNIENIRNTRNNQDEFLMNNQNQPTRNIQGQMHRNIQSEFLMNNQNQPTRNIQGQMHRNQIQLNGLNGPIKHAADYLATKMPSSIAHHPNPIETLSPEDISYLQEYLEKIKIAKLRRQNSVAPVQNTYHNPYEYGSRQNILRPDGNLSQGNIGNFADNIRDVNVESSLLQRELTHLPGQRQLTQGEVNRFEYLPFDPQNPDRLVWADDMPRNGYATRVSRV